MKELPDDIKRIIWSFDNTYHIIFNYVLQEIRCIRRRIESIIDSFNSSGLRRIYFFQYLHRILTKNERDILLNDLISYRNRCSKNASMFPFSERTWCNHIITQFNKANNLNEYI